MQIYYQGPEEHRDAALSASQYHRTKWVEDTEEADAILVVWDGREPKPTFKTSKEFRAVLLFVYLIP